MTRCSSALAALIAFTAISTAAPVPLNQLTTPVLQDHFRRYLDRAEAKADLERIAPFATLTLDGLSYSNNTLSWQYTARIALTVEQEKRTRDVAESLLIQGLANFDGGLLTKSDIEIVMKTLRVANSQVVPEAAYPINGYGGYAYWPYYGGQVYRYYAPWHYHTWAAHYYPWYYVNYYFYSGYGAYWTYWPHYGGYYWPYSYYPYYGYPYGRAYYPAATAPVSYELAPDNAKKLVSASVESLLGEVQSAYRGRNYAAAKELVVIALEKDAKNPLLWCWRSAVESQLGLKADAEESALRFRACLMLEGTSYEQIATRIEIIQGPGRTVLSNAAAPKDTAAALALASQPVTVTNRTKELVSK